MSKLKIFYLNEVTRLMNHCTKCSERWKSKCKSMTRVYICCVKIFDTITYNHYGDAFS